MLTVVRGRRCSGATAEEVRVVEQSRGASPRVTSSSATEVATVRQLKLDPGEELADLTIRVELLQAIEFDNGRRQRSPLQPEDNEPSSNGRLLRKSGKTTLHGRD